MSSGNYDSSTHSHPFEPVYQELLGPHLRDTYKQLRNSVIGKNGRVNIPQEAQEGPKNVRKAAEQWTAIQNSAVVPNVKPSSPRLNKFARKHRGNTKLLVEMFDPPKQVIEPKLFTQQSQEDKSAIDDSSGGKSEETLAVPITADPKSRPIAARPRQHQNFGRVIPERGAPFKQDATLEDMIEQLFPNCLQAARNKDSLENKLLIFLLNYNDPDRPLGKQLIRRERMLGEDLIGVEKITRMPVIPDAIKMCLENIRLGINVEYNTDRLGKLCSKFNRDYEHRPHKAEWIDSFEFRYLAGTQERDPFRNKDYSSIMEDSYVQAPVNLRKHSFTTGTGEETSWLRCGVFTDLSNGLLNYKEMKEIVGDPSKGILPNGDLLEKKIRELEEMLPKAKTERARQSIRHAITSLHTLDKKIEITKLGLEDQMLTLVFEHLKSKAKDLKGAKNGTLFPIAQVSLLNEKTRKIDGDSGWAHFEDNAMITMESLFDDFSGKEIYFDRTLKSPIMKDGIIYMPYINDVQVEHLTLETLFFNISPQKNTENSPIQKPMNEKAMKKLEVLLAAKKIKDKDYTRSVKNIKKQHRAKVGLEEKGNSSYTIAANIAYTLVTNGIATGLDCASAKDRSGGVSGAICLHIENRAVDKMESHPRSEREKYKKAQKGRIIKQGETNSEVAYDSNGKGIMKIDPRAQLEGASRMDVVQNSVEMYRHRTEENKYGNYAPFGNDEPTAYRFPTAEEKERATLRP